MDEERIPARYQYQAQRKLKNNQNQSQKHRIGYPLFFRFLVALSLYLCYLAIHVFPDFFPKELEIKIFEYIIQNDWYTKLQNYVIMILYEL